MHDLSGVIRNLIHFAYKEPARCPAEVLIDSACSGSGSIYSDDYPRENLSWFVPYSSDPVDEYGRSHYFSIRANNTSVEYLVGINYLEFPDLYGHLVSSEYERESLNA